MPHLRCWFSLQNIVGFYSLRQLITYRTLPTTIHMIKWQCQNPWSSIHLTCPLLYTLHTSVGLWLSITKKTTFSSGWSASTISIVPPQFTSTTYFIWRKKNKIIIKAALPLCTFLVSMEMVFMTYVTKYR